MSDEADDGKTYAGKDREFLGSFNGFVIRVDPNLAPGTVQFRNGKGELIGTIYNVKDIDIPESP